MKSLFALTLLTLATTSYAALVGTIDCSVYARAKTGSRSQYSIIIDEVKHLTRSATVETFGNGHQLNAKAGVSVSNEKFVKGNQVAVKYQIVSFLGPEDLDLYNLNSGREISIFLQANGKSSQVSATVMDGGKISTTVNLGSPGWFDYKITSVSLECKLNNL